MMRMKMMITCKEATRMVSKKEEGKLSSVNRVRLWYHFAICSLCRLFYRQNDLLTKDAAGSFPTAPLSEQQKTEIIEALEKSTS